MPGSAGVLSTVLAYSDSHSLHSGTAKYNVGWDASCSTTSGCGCGCVAKMPLKNGRLHVESSRQRQGANEMPLKNGRQHVEPSRQRQGANVAGGHTGCLTTYEHDLPRLTSTIHEPDCRRLTAMSKTNISNKLKLNSTDSITNGSVANLGQPLPKP